MGIVLGIILGIMFFILTTIGFYLIVKNENENLKKIKALKDTLEKIKNEWNEADRRLNQWNISELEKKSLREKIEKYKLEYEEKNQEINSFKKSKNKNSFWFFLSAGIVLIIFSLVPFSLHKVDTGEVAVVKKWGVATEVKQSGLYFDFWLSHKYQRYDTKVQQIIIETQAYSSDSQTMDIELVIQYQITNALEISKNYGALDMLENRISTISIEKMKSVLSKKQAMTIIETRAEVSPDVENIIRNAITDDYYVNVTTVVLTDISFTDTFEDVIEKKMIAEQQKIQAEYEKEKAIIQAEQQLEVAKLEAEAQLEKARKEAEATEVKAEAESNALKIIQDAWESIDVEVRQVMLQEMAIDKWSGELPDTMVGTEFLEWLMGTINTQPVI